MKLTTLTSTAALLAAFAVAPAAAQSMDLTINGNVVSESDLPYVQARCDELQAEADTSLSTEDDATDQEDTTGDDGTGDDGTGDDGTGDDGTGDDGTGDDATGDATMQDDDEDEGADEGDNALTTIDLDTLTVEQCEEGGFYDDTM